MQRRTAENLAELEQTNALLASENETLKAHCANQELRIRALLDKQKLLLLRLYGRNQRGRRVASAAASGVTADHRQRNGGLVVKLLGSDGRRTGAMAA